jgi:hypothetical protein
VWFFVKFSQIENAHARKINMTLQEIVADIHALEKELLAFERKFGIWSEAAGPGGGKDVPENYSRKPHVSGGENVAVH